MTIEEIFLESHLGFVRKRYKYPQMWELVIRNHKVRVTELKEVGRRFPVVFSSGYLLQTLKLNTYHPEDWTEGEKTSLRGIKNKIDNLKKQERSWVD